MSPFSFSLSHTLTVFLSIFRTTPPIEALSFLCFCFLWNSQPMAKKGSRFQLCSQGRMAFVFLLFFFASFSVSHTPKSLPKENGSWLWNTSHYEKSDLPCFGHFSINEKKKKKLALKTFGISSWISFDNACGLDPHGKASNNLPFQPITEEIFNRSLQSEFMPANPTQSFSFSLDTTLVNMSAGFFFCVNLL